MTGIKRALAPAHGGIEPIFERGHAFSREENQLTPVGFGAC
jgi:phosphotransferase system IIA component